MVLEGLEAGAERQQKLHAAPIVFTADRDRLPAAHALGRARHGHRRDKVGIRKRGCCSRRRRRRADGVGSAGRRHQLPLERAGAEARPRLEVVLHLVLVPAGRPGSDLDRLWKGPLFLQREDRGAGQPGLRHDFLQPDDTSGHNTLLLMLPARIWLGRAGSIQTVGRWEASTRAHGRQQGPESLPREPRRNAPGRSGPPCAYGFRPHAPKAAMPASTSLTIATLGASSASDSRSVRPVSNSSSSR